MPITITTPLIQHYNYTTLFRLDAFDSCCRGNSKAICWAATIDDDIRPSQF